MSKTYVGIKLQDLGLYNTLDPKDKIVIVKDKDEGVLQLKDFFLYVQSNLDLSNYYTSTQADTIFMAKVDAYTRKDADVKFALVEKTYTRTQSDSRFALASDTFNKAEIEGKYASKEQMYTKDLVYTKEESITAFALKTEIPIMPDLTPYSTTAKGDLRWALKVDVFSKTEADARFANINNYYTKSESDNKYALLSNTYTKAETDNKFLDTTEAYTKDYINLNIYTKTQVYTKAETDGKYPLKTDVYTVTAVNDQFAAKSWVYSRAEADNTFRKLADSYNRAEVNALIDASKSGLSTDVSSTYYTKTDTDAKFELKGTAYNKIDSDAKYALISNSISPSQVAAKYYNKTEIDKSLGDAATNTSNLFALKTAAVGGISLTPTNLTFTKVDGTSSLVAIPTWNQSTTGNAATATKLQTARNIGITGAVTATGISFDGSSNININATSVDASKLTGIVPASSLSGNYAFNFVLSNTSKISRVGSRSETFYGVLNNTIGNDPGVGYIVIRTKILATDSAMNNLNIQIATNYWGEFDNITLQWYRYGGWIGAVRTSSGNSNTPITLAIASDNTVAIILGASDYRYAWANVSIPWCTAYYFYNPNSYNNWSLETVTNLDNFTELKELINSESVSKINWNNVQNRPTTVSGYGITDAYTKSDIYTKTESDNRFSFKQESIKSATLNTSTLSFTKADNTVSNISIPTWNQSTTGNAATATKLATPRTINGVAFDGSGDISTPATGTVTAIDDRVMVPNDLPLRSLGVYFTSKGGLETTAANGTWGDFLTLNTWGDSSGGGVNALFFTKGSQGIYHYFTPFGSTNPFPTPKQLAYTDSNITGNAASASKWLTARTFNITGDASWSASVDGSSDITGTLTLANTGVIPGTYTKVTIDSKGRATSASNLVPADVPNLDMSKVNTGVLGISQGGTGATTATTARTNLGLGTSAVLNVGAVNGVASLDASGKVPTSQLYINNTLTSTDTTVPLTAAQGKVLNDSIGITNTNLQTLTNRLDTNYYLKSDVFTKTEITTNYFDKTYVNNNFLAQAANKDVSIAGFINAGKDILFTTSLTGIKWNMNTDMASISFKNNGDDDSDSYLGFDVGDNGDEYFRWSFSASSSNKIAMSLRRDKLEINNSVATLGLSTSATLTDISKIPQYGIYSKGGIKTDGQIITNATSYHENISDLGVGDDSPIKIPNYEIPLGKTGYIPFLHGSVLTAGNGYTMHSSLGLYRANNTWWNGGMYMAIGGDDRYPTAAFRFKLDGTIDFTGGSVNLVGNASSATKLQTARTISLTGDGSWSTSFDGTGNSTGSFVLSNSGVNAGTYTKVTVDSKGRVTSGTGLLAGDIPALDTSKLTSGTLPIARGGTGAGDSATARTNLGLGTAATRNVGTNSGDVITVGSFGFGSSVSAGYDDSMATGDVPAGFFRYADSSAKKPPMVSTYDVFGISIPRHGGSTGGLLWFPYHVSDTQRIVYQSHYPGQTRYHVLYTDQNTPNEDVTVKSLTVKNLSGTTDYAPNLYYHTDGKLYKANQPALLKSQADTYYSPINLTKLYAPDSRSTGHVKPNTIPVKALSVAFADINTSFGINNGYPWGDVIVLNTWDEPSGGNPNAIITSRGGSQGIWHAYGPFNGSSWSSIKQIAYTDSNITGNAASATKLQNSRYFNIIGAAAADPVYFDGTGNVSLNVTAMDATKLLGKVPTGSLSGGYTFDFTMNNDNGRIIKYGNGTETYFGLLNYSKLGEDIKGYFVIKTAIPKDRKAMNILQLQIFENYNGVFDNITLQWYRYGNWVGQIRTSTGVKEVPIALGITPDNMVAIIIGNTNFSFAYPSFNIPWCTAHYGFDGTNYKGWTVEYRSDLTGYTDVVDLVNRETTTAVNWSRVGSKPTTLAGYGITDAWTSTGSDNRYVMLNESRAIALNNSVTMRKISLARNGGTGGISWYSEGYTAWQDYMAAPGSGNGFAGNITAPSGTLVTSWAKRSFIENSNGYGWTFESGTSASVTPTVVAEIRSSDGAARFGGTVQADGGFRFPNSTWNPVGDDVFIGDKDVAGSLCIKSANLATMAGIAFFNQAGSRLGTFFSRESDFWFDKQVTSDNGFYSGATITLKSPVVKNSIVELGTGTDAALYTATKAVDGSAPRWLPLIHGSTVSSGSGYTNHCSFGMYRHQNNWDNAGFYMAVGGSDASPTEAFYFRLGGRLEHSSGDIKTRSLVVDSWMTAGTVITNSGYIVSDSHIANYTKSWAPQTVLTGGLLASNDYSAAERAKIPANGIYSKGIILTEAGYGCKDVRAFAPSSMTKKSVNFYFTSENGLATGTTEGGNFGDFISLNSYHDDTAGNQNGLFFDKKNFRILHYSPAFGASTWGTPKQIAYTDSNITGSAASATKLQTARSIGDRVFDGTGNITLGGTIQTDTIYNGSYIGFYTAPDRNTAQQIRAGSILSSHTWGDAGYVPANGIFSRGDIYTGSNLRAEGSIYAGGVLNTGSYVSTSHLINRGGNYYSDNRHAFLTTSGNAQYMNVGGILVSDSYADAGNVPSSGIWAKGDIKSGAWIYSAGKVIAGTDITAGGSITAQGNVNANGVRTTDIVVSTTATIANATVSGSITVPDQSIISADGLAVNTRTTNTKIRYALDYSPATAAAWINFSYMYDSTAGTNVITVKSSYNISNITRIGTGIYKVEFLRAFENEHFVMSGYARDDDGGGDVIIGQQSGQVFTSTTAVFSVASGSGNKMPTSAVCTVLFFGKRYGGAWLL